MGHDFLRGAGLLLLSTVLYSMSDTMAKYATQSVPAVELLSIRYGVFTFLAALPLLRRGRGSRRSRRPALQILRGLAVVGSSVTFVLALASLPIAEATAISFITPLLITVLAIPVLGEVVRPQGWAAVLVGFVGMLVVVRPGLGGFKPAAILVIASSSFWCVSALVTRRMAGVDRSDVTLLWTAGTGLVLMLAALPFFAVGLPTGTLALCLAVGVVSSGGQWCTLLAFRMARASSLAPLNYAQLIWAAALGFLVFGTVPDVWTLVGAAIIAASGLYVVRLERGRAG